MADKKLVGKVAVVTGGGSGITGQPCLSSHVTEPKLYYWTELWRTLKKLDSKWRKRAEKP